MLPTVGPADESLSQRYASRCNTAATRRYEKGARPKPNYRLTFIDSKTLKPSLTIKDIARGAKLTVRGSNPTLSSHTMLI
jgi:hypothetical protein